MNLYKRKKLLDRLINSTRVKICTLKKRLSKLESELVEQVQERNELDSQLSNATILIEE